MSARADRFRQRHLAPVSWEGPVLAGLLLLTVATAVPLAVQAVAGLVVSGHWAWPSGHLVDAIAGLVQGRFGAGFSAEVRQSLPPTPWLWALTGAFELLIMLTVGLVLSRWIQERSWSAHGLAGRAEARRALGSRTLRRRARTVRPDLFASRRRPRAPGMKSARLHLDRRSTRSRAPR